MNGHALKITSLVNMDVPDAYHLIGCAMVFMIAKITVMKQGYSVVSSSCDRIKGLNSNTCTESVNFLGFEVDCAQPMP